MSLSLPIDASFHVLLSPRDDRLRKTIGSVIYTEGGDWIRSRVIRYMRGFNLWLNVWAKMFSINCFFIEIIILLGHPYLYLWQQQTWYTWTFHIKKINNFTFSFYVYLFIRIRNLSRNFFKLSLYELKYSVIHAIWNIKMLRFLTFSLSPLVILVTLERQI